jgi:hypothetical protein
MRVYRWSSNSQPAAPPWRVLPPYLLRLRWSERRALGIKTATVARDRPDFGMLLEPFREALGGPVRKEIDDAAQVQIDQNGSVVLAFTPSPIVDAQVANRECGWATELGRHSPHLHPYRQAR